MLTPQQIAEQRRRVDRWGRDREQAEAERRVQRLWEDAEQRAWIEAGNDERQPEEYRGRVFDHADNEGVHPSSFPPYRWDPQEGLCEEFIAFQAHNQTTYEKNPRYYCVRCRIRYNARDGGMCGPCLGELEQAELKQTPLFDDVPLQPRLPDYPL